MYLTSIHPEFKNLELVDFLKNAFQEDICKGDGRPYFDHCITVANLASSLLEEKTNQFSSQLYTLGLCHDLLEDHPEKFQELRSIKGIDLYAELALKTLTYCKNLESRSDYIEKICKSNDFVKLVKMADLIHNSTISRTKTNDVAKEIKRIEKYMKEFLLVKQSLSSSFI
jgi:hypothetical protein